jgi:hypothetical protein
MAACKRHNEVYARVRGTGQSLANGMPIAH